MTNNHNESSLVTWTCSQCSGENTTHLRVPQKIICDGCKKSIDWEQIHADVGTYHGGEETTVKLCELVLVDKQVVDSGIELTKASTETERFTMPFAPDKIPAYFGSFGEYVPVDFSYE